MPKGRATTITDQLRRAIRQAERRGITKYQISKATGMPRSQVGRIASGETVPKIDTAQRVAEAVGYRLALVPIVAK